MIRSKSRIACVNQITTVKLTSMIRNATKVVRKMYRPIDPIGLDFPTDGQPKAAPDPPDAAPRRDRTPPMQSFMLSQNGLGKANLLNMHNNG